MDRQELVQWISSWGPPGVFLLALIDSAGVPLPAGVDASVVVTAALAPRLWLATGLLAAVGSTAGCAILYWIGLRGGEAVLRKTAPTKTIRAAQLWFRRYGLLVVFIPALVPIPLPLKVFILLAGFFRVSWRLFLLTIIVARTGRYVGLAFVASRAGENPRTFFQEHWIETALVIMVLLALFVVITKRFRQLDLVETE